MIRNLLILLAVTLALALARWLIRDVARAVIGVLKKGGENSDSSGSHAHQESNRLVRDAFSGTYIDERFAIKETIDGQTFFFESEDNRDSYRREHMPSGS